MKNQSSKGGKELINLQTSAHENCTSLGVLVRVKKGRRSDVGKEKIANLVYLVLDTKEQTKLKLKKD